MGTEHGAKMTRNTWSANAKQLFRSIKKKHRPGRLVDESLHVGMALFVRLASQPFGMCDMDRISISSVSWIGFLLSGGCGNS